MKKLIVLLIILTILLSFAMHAFAAETPTIVCEDVACKPGDQITVQVFVANNPGFAYLEITPEYAEGLTLLNAKNGDLISDFTKGKQYVWISDEDTTEDGLLMTVSFAVSETIAAGEYSVSFIVRTCGNYNEDPVDFSVQSGTVTVESEQSVVSVIESSAQSDQYSDFGEAVNACSKNGYVQLLDDVQTNISLSKDLYVDLNGYNMAGTVESNGYKIYGMDSTTNSYNCSNIGYFTCTDENGNIIIPETHFKSSITGSIKRYMAIKTDAGYSFHRFYLGITHMSIRPSVTSVGFKAAFYGDDKVSSMLSKDNAFGYSMTLAGHEPLTVYNGADSFESGKAVTLRIDNFDVDNYGETNLYAAVMLKLSDGTVIESAQCAMTMRNLLETLNTNYTALTADQLTAVADLIKKYAIISTWKVENLIAV